MSDDSSSYSPDSDLYADYEDHTEITSELPLISEKPEKPQISKRKGNLRDLIGKYFPQAVSYVHIEGPKGPDAPDYMHVKGPDGPGYDQFLYDRLSEQVARDNEEKNANAAKTCKAVLDYYLDNC